MKNAIFASLFAVMVLMSASCDDGRIYPESVSAPDGKVVKLQGMLQGVDSWPDGYHLALAGFTSTDAEYAEISRLITVNDVQQDGKVSMTLEGIKDNVIDIRLCVLDRLRRHVVTFGKVEVTTATDTIRLDVGQMNVTMFDAVQQTVFNTTCANCHGASTQAAAGLFLTEGRSYKALVGQPSRKVEGAKIVEPGNASGSVLYQALTTNLSAGWRYNHQSEVTSEDLLQLVHQWIERMSE